MYVVFMEVWLYLVLRVAAGLELRERVKISTESQSYHSCKLVTTILAVFFGYDCADRMFLVRTVEI